MNKFFNNIFYKLYKIFLLLSGLFFLFVYGVKIRTDADNLIFADKSIAAVKFTFSELLFLPLAAFMAYISVLIMMYIINTVKSRAFIKPDKILVIKHIGVLALIISATFIAMQFNTVLYTDGRISTHNYIEKLSPEYATDDYDKVIFCGEVKGSVSPERPYRTYFQFGMTFYLSENEYVEFYPEEFRDFNAIYSIRDTLGDKFQTLPKEGFPASIKAEMSEGERELYRVLYKEKSPQADYYDYDDDEDETEQSHYAFDGYYDFN